MAVKGKPIHAPDEPIPEEILARMTKPVIHERYQIVVELTRNCRMGKKGSIIRVGPTLHDKPLAEECVSVINLGIIGGREKYWSKPQIVTTQY